MSAFWIVALGVAGIGMVAIIVALRRAESEIEPTIRAFAGLRDALRPVVAEVDTKTTATGQGAEALGRSDSRTPER